MGAEPDLVGRWWNRSYSPRRRRDLWLYCTGGVWRVEASTGLVLDAVPWVRAYPDEASARGQVEAMMARSGDRWLDVMAWYR